MTVLSRRCLAVEGAVFFGRGLPDGCRAVDGVGWRVGRVQLKRTPLKRFYLQNKAIMRP